MSLRLQWNPFCCCGPPPCIPTCIGAGTVGSESGAECATCGTSVITDTFSGALDPAWINKGDTCIGTQTTSTAGGVLTMSGGGYVLRPFARPALSGFCVEVKVTIPTMSVGGGIGGIVLAYGPSMFPRPTFSNYGRRSCTTVDGCADGAGTFATFGITPANGDTLRFIIRDEGGGDEGDESVICSICYQLNGTTYRVDEGCLCCFPTTMYAGIFDNASSTNSYDDFEVRTN